MEFLSSSFLVKDLHSGAILLRGTTKDGVYEWPTSDSVSSPILAFSSVKTTSSNWHHRLGHPSFPILQHIVPGFSLDLSSPMSKDFLCHSCHCNKSHKLPFSYSSLVSSQLLEFIFSDVWTSPVVSHEGFKYYVIFVDHYTKYIWFYPLKRKSEVKENFIRFRAIVENFLKPKSPHYTLTMAVSTCLSENTLPQLVSHISQPHPTHLSIMGTPKGDTVTLLRRALHYSFMPLFH